jgi:hypothetical protein
LKEASTQFQVTEWKETTTTDPEGPQKHTHVLAKKQYTGTMQGEGIVEYLLFYHNEETSRFVGYERFTGSIEGKEGSVVFEHKGTFADNVVTESSQSVEGAGQGELANWGGTLSFSAGLTEQTTTVAIMPKATS